MDFMGVTCPITKQLPFYVAIANTMEASGGRDLRAPIKESTGTMLGPRITEPFPSLSNLNPSTTSPLFASGITVAIQKQ